MTGKNENSERIGTKKAKAVAALLKCGTVTEAAQSIEISARTLQRWKAQPAFAAALVEAQKEIFGAVCNELRGLGTDAALTLGEIMRDTGNAPASRVRACLAILNLLLKSHDREIIEFRVTALESRRGPR